MSLYRKLVLASTAVSLVLVAVFSWQNHMSNVRMADQVRLQRIELLSEIVSNGLKTIMLEGRPKEEFQRFIENLAAEDIEAVRIFAEDGRILSSTIPGEIGKTVDQQHLRAFKEQQSPSLLVHMHEGRKVYSTIMVMSNDWPCQRCHGQQDQIRAIVDLEVAHRRIDAAAKTAAGWTVGLAAVMVVMSFLAFTFLLRGQLRAPLDRLVAEVRAMAGGDLAARATVQGTSELGQLASAVNRIASELRAAYADVILHENREMSQTEKMASIGEVAATVAHEIKNPLAGISGALQVMVEDMSPDSPRKEICNEILTEIERLDRAVKDLVAFARPQEINPVATDLNDVTRRAVMNTETAAQRAGVAISLHAGDLPKVMADPVQIEKVLSDILRFQTSHMPDGGSIAVSSRYREDRGDVEIVSADSGPVLSGERLRTIFKPSFSTKDSNTGLSLAIARNIVASHGGRIEVSAEFGIGNSFHIIIPAER